MKTSKGNFKNSCPKSRWLQWSSSWIPIEICVIKSKIVHHILSRKSNSECSWFYFIVGFYLLFGVLQIFKTWKFRIWHLWSHLVSNPHNKFVFYIKHPSWKSLRIYIKTFIFSGELDVVVKRVESTHICSGSQDVMPAYKMTAYPRGLALIIEIEEFVNNVEKPRIGSHVSFFVSYCFKTTWWA